MENFYVSLDDFGQIDPSGKEQNILLGIGALFILGSLFLLAVGISQEAVYLLLLLVNTLLCLTVGVACIGLARRRNLFQLPLGTFFQVTDAKISFKLSIFGSTTTYHWDEIQKAEMSIFMVHLWIKSEIQEIDLQDIQNRNQQLLIKQQVRKALTHKGFIKQTT
jgi:hypothetical protein